MKKFLLITLTIAITLHKFCYNSDNSRNSSPTPIDIDINSDTNSELSFLMDIKTASAIGAELLCASNNSSQSQLQCNKNSTLEKYDDSLKFRNENLITDALSKEANTIKMQPTAFQTNFSIQTSLRQSQFGKKSHYNRPGYRRNHLLHESYKKILQTTCSFFSCISLCCNCDDSKEN